MILPLLTLLVLTPGPAADPGTFPVAPGTFPVTRGTFPADPGTLPADPGTFPAVQSPLEGGALTFAQAWEREDLRFLEEAMAEDGIRLHLPGEEHVLIRPRQARAALGAFLERYSEGEAQVTRVSLAGGDPGKGFAEISWRTGSPGVPEPVSFTLSVAFASEDESWSVTEIRVLF